MRFVHVKKTGETVNAGGRTMLSVSRVKLKAAHEVEAVSKDLAALWRRDLDRDVALVAERFSEPGLCIQPALHKRCIVVEGDELEEGILGLAGDADAVT